MKKLIISLVLLPIVVSCGERKKNEYKNEQQEIVNKEETGAILASGDYSSLLGDYTCGMDIAEVAKILEVPASNLSIPKYATPEKCMFELKGYGEDALGGVTIIGWAPSKNSKADNKNEINTYLKNQRKLTSAVTMGMGIVLADTKDCYLAFQPAHGRIIIINEHYDNMFLLYYGTNRTLKSRTVEQQKELQEKMTVLANYLLKKHRK